jgi:hypothetical protein
LIDGQNVDRQVRPHFIGHAFNARGLANSLMAFQQFRAAGVHHLIEMRTKRVKGGFDFLDASAGDNVSSTNSCDGVRVWNTGADSSDSLFCTCVPAQHRKAGHNSNCQKEPQIDAY